MTRIEKSNFIFCLCNTLDGDLYKKKIHRENVIMAKISTITHQTVIYGNIKEKGQQRETIIGT